MKLGNIARVVTVAAACFAAVGSATSSSNNPPMQPHQQNTSPPPPQQMEPSRALGLWRSTFGAVKIEADNSRGGIASGAVQGIWVYQRQGQEVIGYFNGGLRGNVLDFRWQEPGVAGGPPLVGAGYLVFEQTGRQYSGRWWSDKRDRVGDWNGWRQAAAQPQSGAYGGSPYGGQPDVGAPPPDPQPQPPPYGPQEPSPYGPQQPSPYGPQQPSPYGPQQPSPYGPQQPQRSPYPSQQPGPQQPGPQQPGPQQPAPYQPSQPQPYYPPPR